MNILVIGSRGRMGSLLCEMAKGAGHCVLGIDKGNRQDAKSFVPDVVVDFSCAECLPDNLGLALDKKAPIVVATTGHDKENYNIIDKFKTQIAIFMAPNMSILFNLLLKIAKNLKLPPECDVILQETHHKHKQDCPSGSAKELLGALERKDVKVISNRVGEVVGEHKLSIFLGKERLELFHIVESREVFCEGTIKACEFIIKKPFGLYGMQDLLGNLFQM